MSIDCNEINDSIEKAVSETIDEINNDEETWPRSGFKLFGRNLFSPEAYLSAFSGQTKNKTPMIQGIRTTKTATIILAIFMNIFS